ncbi:MAG: polysaccharide biosynthesis protein [Chloroflexi bacterium]|nr:MAG: polysaccharide biosynthesis protein [Chloroflexota bacterium]
MKIRNRYFFLFDLLILCTAPSLALMLHLDTLLIPKTFYTSLIVYTGAALVVRLAIFYYAELYRRYWKYASVDELKQIVLAVVLSSALVALLAAALFSLLQLPVVHSVFFLDSLLVLISVGGLRFSIRILAQQKTNVNGNGRKVIIAGAGEAGTLIVRELRRNPQLNLKPVGFVDDDHLKLNMQIHGLPVLGTLDALDTLIPSYKIQQVIIAMPTAPGSVIREVALRCEHLNVSTKTVPGIYELVDGTVSVNQLRNVEIKDLLRREPVKTDIARVQQLIQGQRVLITGGGGSIGSELCRQVWRCQPAELILLGHGENSIFESYHELRRLGASQEQLTAVIADVRFPERLHAVFQQVQPDIVFHAAAHKHVPLMEMNPAEAITNNVMGTRNLLDAALAGGVERFVMISTDKAVNPTSVMGASKRTAELLVHQAAKRSGKPYVAVRFGNVLGSRGSVVLTFKQQIANGGPVTVTDPEMKRFFMTIPEAVQLVLQAGVLGRGGEVFVLDMGEPVKISDLAQDLIELSGLEVGQDIKIQYTGMRPGEKMFEELFVPGEKYTRTEHEKIFIAANASSFVPEDLDAGLSALKASAKRNDREGIIRGLQNLVPEYEPMRSKDRAQNGHVAEIEMTMGKGAVRPKALVNHQ